MQVKATTRSTSHLCERPATRHKAKAAADALDRGPHPWVLDQEKRHVPAKTCLLPMSARLKAQPLEGADNPGELHVYTATPHGHEKEQTAERAAAFVRAARPGAADRCFPLQDVLAMDRKQASGHQGRWYKRHEGGKGNVWGERNVLRPHCGDNSPAAEGGKFSDGRLLLMSTRVWF